MGAGDEDDDNRIPTVAEMKEIVNAVTAQRPPRTRSTKPANMTNPDGTPKFRFHEDHCWYRDAKGHDRQNCVATSTRNSLQPTGRVDLLDMKALLKRLERRTEQSMARATPLAQVEILIPVNDPQDPRPARVATEEMTNT